MAMSEIGRANFKSDEDQAAIEEGNGYLELCLVQGTRVQCEAHHSLNNHLTRDSLDFDSTHNRCTAVEQVSPSHAPQFS